MFVRKAGLPEAVHFHTIRHTFGTWLVEIGVPLPYVKEIMGHSSITTTLIYAHHSPEHLQAAIGQLDEIILN